MDYNKLNDNEKKTNEIVFSWLVIYDKLVKYLFKPSDPSSLGVIRFFFGLLMLLDLSEERGGANLDLRWGKPENCHFPLFNILHPLNYHYMSLLYGIMWIGACGITIGYKFTLSTFLFGIPYWYIFLLDKSFWNNHSYLYGIVTILLMGSCADNFFSLESYFNKKKLNKDIPYWNYFILKYQFFMLYFLAGLKKADMEWLEGYSMTDLGSHWVFTPFKILLTTEQIDHFIIHWFGFLLDLTIGFWMLLKITRPIAMVFCACFHLMNSRLFSIGMFPYVCLATMPLFCEETWPRKILKFFNKKTNFQTFPSLYCIYNNNNNSSVNIINNNSKIDNDINISLPKQIRWKHRFIVGLLLTHCSLQIFLPYSHFITKGYNNWTNGLYGYSWDMMVHSWDTVLVIVKIVDNESGDEHFLDPLAWTQNDRWTKHGDMCIQYAQCIKNNVLSMQREKQTKGDDYSVISNNVISKNISIYIDVWCSLNKRFQQRMYNPNYDLLKANWSPFKSVEWLMPLLSKYNNFRTQMDTITREVYSWSNFSDVLFISDFPGLFLENYISNDLRNVSLTVLEGEVLFEVESQQTQQSTGIKLMKGDSIYVETDVFHKIHTISSNPSCYMYIFINKSREIITETNILSYNQNIMYSPFPIFEDFDYTFKAFFKMTTHIYKSLLYLFFNEPLDFNDTIKRKMSKKNH